MRINFNGQFGLIIVRVQLWGQTGNAYANLALDTGATVTLVDPTVLVSIGCDPAASSNRSQMTTGSGVEYVPRLSLDRFLALGHERTQFEIIAHTLPPSASVDGVLGLDFFRDNKLTIDFRNGRISLG